MTIQDVIDYLNNSYNAEFLNEKREFKVIGAFIWRVIWHLDAQEKQKSK